MIQYEAPYPTIVTEHARHVHSSTAKTPHVKGTTLSHGKNATRQRHYTVARQIRHTSKATSVIESLAHACAVVVITCRRVT